MPYMNRPDHLAEHVKQIQAEQKRAKRIRFVVYLLMAMGVISGSWLHWVRYF